MDTKSFNKYSPEEYKNKLQEHWGNVPCGSNYSTEELLSRDYFNEIEFHRYSTHPWIIENIQNFDIKGKKVLEIGYGIGTDHLALARQGGIMHGIDITPRNLEITQKRFKLFGFTSELIVAANP